MTEHTKDKLAAVLREIGLHEMAERAATGSYHDFLSPLALPEMELEKDLRVAAQAALSFNDQKRAQAIEAVRSAFRRLIEPRSKK
jgi:hypothetical protein